MAGLLLDLVQRVPPLSPETPGDTVYERFQREPDTLAIAVVDEAGVPLGLVERNAFFVAMASQYGRALYARRPISVLMNLSPVVVDGQEAAADFCGQMLAERPSELLRGFIVVDRGRYAGVGSALELLQATMAATQAHAEEMTRLAETLNLATQDAQAALKAKSQFLAVMSHEIRTPLNGVLAIADILARKLHQPELIPYVQSIQGSGETLLRLLTDALDLSRAEAGRLELAEEGFCVPHLLQDIAALWSARAELKGLELVVAYEGAPDQWALGDAIRIKQVFNNLIGNALKFTSQGRVEVRLAALRDGLDVRLEGEVTDTGPGVSEDQLACLFQPFSQDEAGVREGGAGLGLSICRELVGRMGGEIAARCRPGGGMSFTFHIPLFDVPSAEAEGEPAAGEAEAGLSLHVLVVDDNATNRLVARTLCEMFGCTVETAEDGDEAVAAVQDGAFDLVLMDIRMPRLDGLEATRLIRALPGPVAQIPILALTANADPWDAAGYLAQGMNGVVEKPIRAERLAEAITALNLSPGFLRAA